MSSASRSKPQTTGFPCTSPRFPSLRSLADDDGSATLNAFAFLVLVTALAGGLATLTLTGEKSRTDRTLQTRERAEALVTALAVMKNLADATGAPVPPGVTLSDASSALNPNWIRADLFDKTTLKSWFLQGRNGTAFAQDRVDNGLSTNAADRWRDWFRLDVITRSMTTWGPWPVNAADEVSLEQAFVERTGDKASAVRFREGIRRARQERKLLTAETLRGLAAPHEASIMGVFSADPPWNANTLPEDQLRALLAYPAFALPDPDAAANNLLNARNSGPVAKDALPSLLGLAPENLLFTYLGAETLVWRVTVAAGHETLESYWMKRSADSEKASYRPIAREWVGGRS